VDFPQDFDFPVSGLGTSQSSYDHLGRMLSQTSPTGFIVTYQVNALDQVTTVTYPPVHAGDAPSSQSVECDPVNASLRTASTDRSGHRTRTVYDQALRPVQQIGSTGLVSFMVYDSLNRMRRCTVTPSDGPVQITA